MRPMTVCLMCSPTDQNGRCTSTTGRAISSLRRRPLAYRQCRTHLDEHQRQALPHWLDRVDQGWQREYRFKRQEIAGESPHEVWRRQFFATIEDDDLYRCIDLGIDRSIRQLKDHKSKLRDNKGHESMRGTEG